MLATRRCQRPRRPRPRAYFPRPRESLAYLEERPPRPRDFDTFPPPRARPTLAFPRPAETLRDRPALPRDLADASGGSIVRSDKTTTRLINAASFLGWGNLTNIILNLVLPELCDYPMRALLVRLRARDMNSLERRCDSLSNCHEVLAHCERGLQLTCR